jgi:hypothetical protein
MKQTALTYLIDKLELKVMATHIPWVDKIISEALEMERQQIAQAYQQGEWNQGCNGDAEDYLKQTFEDESNT